MQRTGLTAQRESKAAGWDWLLITRLLSAREAGSATTDSAKGRRGEREKGRKGADLREIVIPVFTTSIFHFPFSIFYFLFSICLLKRNHSMEMTIQFGKENGK